MKLPGLLHNLPLLHLILDFGQVAAYTPEPRWGQASALIYNALYIHGGMTDPSNAFSYTSAPINDDLLYLSLSTPFNISSPPWVLVGEPTNSTDPIEPGPAVAWHTLSPLNTSLSLLFGGQPAISSPTVLTLRADSAWLLDILNRLAPSWWQGPMSWADEPLRRIHHTATTTKEGFVFIIGGERADGSQNTFSEHFVFDPAGPSFTQLSTTDSPPGITGHTSVLLPDGRLLVFGGYDPQAGALVSFATIWAIDTTSSPYTWSQLTIVTGTLPNPRRAFAAVVIEGGKVIIHGGCDAHFQATYSDGWVLDMSQNPPTWSQVSSLSQVGQRRDHFAVSSGDQVIFGFGYGSSGPAPAGIEVWKPSDDSFPGTFYPPAPTSISQTLPPSTRTSDPNDPNGPGSGSTGGVHPTATYDPNDPNNPNGPPEGGPFDDNDHSNNKRTTAIAVGTAFAILGLLVGGVIVIYYYRRRNGRTVEGRFMALHDDDPDSPHMEGVVPARILSDKPADTNNRWGAIKNLRIGGALTAVPGGVVGLATTRRTQERRDMLADEDTREFGWRDWRRRNNSSWSLMSFMKRTRSRDVSTSSYGNLSTGSPWREKSDPFSDGAALMQDEETGYIGAVAPGQGGTARPSARRGLSYSSTISSWSDYVDPFSDPIQEELRDIPESSLPRRPYPRPAQQLQVQTVLPSVREVHTLSPVTEASRATLSQSETTASQSSHSTSNEYALSPFDSGHTSQTSYNPRPSSLIDSMSSSQSIRRSDSWWSRFSRTAFLDRRGSGSRRVSGGLYDIRDPNPPPRLVAIEESQHSGSPEKDRESPRSQRSNSIKQSLSRKGSRLYGGHGKSMSSIRTADSEALERMAAMDVVQRERTESGSNRTRESTGTSYDSDWIAEDGTMPNVIHGVDMSFNASSPTEMTSAESRAVPPTIPAPPPAAVHIAMKTSPPPTTTPPASHSSSAASSSTSLSTDGSAGTNRSVRPLSGSNVSARVQAYEQRLSQAQKSPSVTNTKQLEERISKRKSKTPSVGYSLVPRPSLYVANPDHKATPSGDSDPS
ncbi:adagio protein 1-like [Moniliophthora roreri MCA 2997]|uniref:Adagio protein 1-like n=1 Tax=Moniliophthora roreri (strain MCA 2997) TaxID=1381753 RepID=V2XME5_MONRO|nr:adagio protein 1-like [Moniliophthora roreri MCA 2997]